MTSCTPLLDFRRAEDSFSLTPTRCETFESILHQAVFVSKVSRTLTLTAQWRLKERYVDGFPLALLDHDDRVALSSAAPRMKGERGRNVPKPESQKMIFAPNCNWRELLAVLFALPKLDRFEMSLPGVPRITVLNMLKASARNSMRRPSPQNGN